MGAVAEDGDHGDEHGKDADGERDVSERRLVSLLHLVGGIR